MASDSEQSTADLRLEALPDGVVASLEVRNRWRRRVGNSSPGLEFIVSDLDRWPSGSTVRVAFLDGDTDLHRDIEEATQQIRDACSLVLDFGLDESTGEYRRWHESDTEHAAEIRVSFDEGGFWSLVGTDSNDPTVGRPFDTAGGRPGQRSLNLGGFVDDRPSDWRGTVRHEFLHALAFHHSHQNMRGPCQDEFRWEDDEDYEPTQDFRGVFVTDSSGRRPGIYTFLAGEPNGWSKATVDHNLRTADEDTIASAFDPESVMLYRFPALFYRNDPSPCAPTGDGETLSDGDRRGLDLLYPADARASAVKDRADAALGALDGGGPGLEGVAEEPSPYMQRASELLRAHVEPTS